MKSEISVQAIIWKKKFFLKLLICFQWIYNPTHIQEILHNHYSEHSSIKPEMNKKANGLDSAYKNLKGLANYIFSSHSVHSM